MLLSRLELRPLGSEDYVDAFVDGVLLAERWIEEQRRLGCDYVYNDTGLPWGLVNGAFKTAFDDAVRSDGPAHRILTVCGCGIVGCGDVFARVSVSNGLVMFDGIATPRKSLDSLPPLGFDLEAYFDEVRKTHEWFRSTFPRQP